MSLEQFYDDIVTKATVDHSSPEIQDITSAVEEILKLLVSDEIIMDYDEGKLQTKFKFLLSYLQPCGSMAEKTSLWKSVRRAGRERKFIEFDYLAVLDNRDNVVDIREGKCQGCRYVFRENARLEVGTFNESFLSALYSRIPTMCSCIVEPDDTCSETDQRDTRPCDKCTAVRHTGYLQIAKLPDFDLDDVYSREQCSLVFYWTSYTDSLLAPNVETLQLTERIKRLVIRVDFLPAIEIPGNGDGEIKRFIIPKKYPRCFYGCFMVSHSMHELKKIIGVSEKHRQCYIIIKFLYGQLSYWSGADEYLKSYHAKIVFLTHCQTCTEDRDRDRCVTEIFQSLVKTYTSGSLQLPEFHAMKRLNIRHFSNRGGTKECMLLLLHILSQLKSPTETSQCYSQCHPSTAVIKGTCHKMLDGKLGINENDFRIIRQAAAVPALRLLGISLWRSRRVHVLDDEQGRRGLDYVHEEPLLELRFNYIREKLVSSNTSNIGDKVVKEAVMKFQTRKMYVRGKLLFLTSSQSVPVRSNTDSANSFLTPGLDTCCNDDSGETIQTDSIFTGDLQLNWSGFTAERMEQLKRYIKGRRQLKEREHTTTAILKGSKSKGKSKKKEPAKKRRNAKMNQEEEAIEDSDEGDFDDRELDYITDSGESDADLDEKEKEDKYDDKGVDQEHGLKKLIDSEEESCEEENKEEENEEEEETKEEEKKKKKKEGGEESDSSSSSSGSESDIEKDEKISSVLFMQKKKGGSRSSTPTIPEDKEKQALKRKLESDEGAAKKSRTDSPLTTGPISSGEITEDTIRRYLMWKPMTAKELVQKFKSKLPQMTKEQMTQKIGQVLKKINPDRKYVNNILYLSVKKKD